MLRICQNGCTSNGQTGWVADCAREPNSIFERFCASAFSLYPVIPLHYLDSILCSNNNFRANRERVLLCPARLGQDQGEQHNRQGPVLIETVRSLSRQRRPSPLYPPILMTAYPILHHSPGPWQKDCIRRGCDAAQMQTHCLG